MLGYDPGSCKSFDYYVYGEADQQFYFFAQFQDLEVGTPDYEGHVNFVLDQGLVNMNYITKYMKINKETNTSAKFNIVYDSAPGKRTELKDCVLRSSSFGTGTGRFVSALHWEGTASSIEEVEGKPVEAYKSEMKKRGSVNG